MINVEGYLEYRWVFSIMSTVGVILSTVRDTQYHGDNMMHVGISSVSWGVQYCGGTQITKDSPHGTHDIPMVLNTPHCTAHLHGTAHTLYRVFISYTSDQKQLSHLLSSFQFSFHIF